MAIDRLIVRREVHLREKTLWRMLYETVARAEEILGVNIEELDLAGRRAPVKAKGARPRTRRRGAVREDFVLETVYWDAGTARLLPRLLKGRTRGPVFVTHRKPGPGKVVSPRDICPDTGLARLSYGQARMLLDEHTALGGEPGTGWDLHEWRHSGLDPPRRGRGEPAGADGEVPAQEGRERTEVLPPLPGGDRRSYQPARAGRSPTLTAGGAFSGLETSGTAAGSWVRSRASTIAALLY